MTWKNRITRYSEEAPDQLLTNPKNYRTHPGSQADALRGVLGDVGVVQNVLANERTGFLIDGHLRVMEALKAGQPTIPVTWVDLSEEEEALILATLDPLAAMAGTDAAQLDALLRDVSTDSPAVQAMLDALATEAGIVPPVGAGGDEFDATPEDGPTRTQAGDLWVIGGVHRLLVGDCTDAANVARLMGGGRAALVFEDPPYNVAYQDNESIESLKARNRRTDGKIVANDAMSDADFDGFLDRVLAALPLGAGGVYYLCAPAGRTETQFRNALDRTDDMPLRQCIVWLKDRFVFGRQDYHWRHESILYGWKDGAAHYFVDDRTQDTVWEIERPTASPDHPTQKPVGLPERAIGNSSRSGEIVFDGFLGSGTTLIAAHRTGRRCYGMEIEPRYADVILRRAEAEGLAVEKC
jgi:DNA modification methylase